MHSAKHKLHKAVVKSIRNESKLIKSLVLQPLQPEASENNAKFTFKAGQWVDFCVAGVSTVAGFSMTSSPWLLESGGEINLAVKYSPDQPAKWVHTQCKIGDEVNIQVGGDFFYDPQPGDPAHDLVLIAGGVGINPLYSILQHAMHLQQTHRFTSLGKTLLVYSAKCFEELIFQSTITGMATCWPNLRCRFHLTDDPKHHLANQSESESHRTGRITLDTLKADLKGLNTESCRCYICGPPLMIADIRQHLLASGVKDTHIHSEEWW